MAPESLSDSYWKVVLNSTLNNKIRYLEEACNVTDIFVTLKHVQMIRNKSNGVFEIINLISEFFVTIVSV